MRSHNYVIVTENWLAHFLLVFNAVNLLIPYIDFFDLVKLLDLSHQLTIAKKNASVLLFTTLQETRLPPSWEFLKTSLETKIGLHPFEAGNNGELCFSLWIQAVLVWDLVITWASNVEEKALMFRRPQLYLLDLGWGLLRLLLEQPYKLYQH